MVLPGNCTHTIIRPGASGAFFSALKLEGPLLNLFAMRVCREYLWDNYFVNTVEVNGNYSCLVTNILQNIFLCIHARFRMTQE